MNANYEFNAGLAALEASDLRTAIRHLRMVCYANAPDQLRRRALTLQCRAMDNLGMWHESESEAVRVHRFWDAQAERRARSERTFCNLLAGTVAAACIVSVVAAMRPSRQMALAY